MRQSLLQPDTAQCFARLAADIDIGLGAVHQGQLDIFGRCRARQQVKLLEHEADRLVADPGALFGRQVANRLALQLVLARVRPVEQAENVHQGGLARPGCADHGDKLALVNLEIHIAKDMQRTFAGSLKRLAQVSYSDHDLTPRSFSNC